MSVADLFEPIRHDKPRVGRRRDDWWRGAVIYQVYPRSFQDTNGDGIGDLPGIARRLDHIASLGVDAVWISPFMRSPQKDFGYDVSDYRDVDPMFGTLEDFDRLLAEAHRLGLKVLIDFVASHTSDKHPWFIAARGSRSGEKHDWYVFADPKPDGSPPNNWQAVFGGSAWEWEPRRGQYYLHNFLKEQPDLNFHNPAVIEALLGEAEFWLRRGVDGFRLDAIDFGVHDPLLRDNPPRPDAVPTGGLAGSPFGMQVQLYNKARPELADLFFKPLHALTERYGGAVLLAEIAGDRALQRIAEYSHGGGIDMAYSFDLLTCAPTALGIRTIMETLEEAIGEGWACVAFSNHDVTRAVTRFAKDRPAPDDTFRAMIPILLTCLRGTVCLYQGEELGLEEAEIAFEDLKDPYGITFWPIFKGRDGCRTPMPWEALLHEAGFTTGTPWLPIPHAHRVRAVDRQAGDPWSCLGLVRAFLQWRRDHPALRRGSISFLNGAVDVLQFTRVGAGERLICAFNLGSEAQPLALGRVGAVAPGSVVPDDEGRLVLPPGAYIVATSVAGEDRAAA